MILEEYLTRQQEWFLNVFGPGSRDKGLVAHIKGELEEILSSPWDIEEWIDVIILGFEGALRNAGGVNEVVACLQKKQEKNFKRTWPDWTTMDPDNPIEHVKTGK